MPSRLFWGRFRLTATTTRNCTCTWKSPPGQTSDLKIPLLHFCTKTCMAINQHSNNHRTYCRHRSARAWSCEYLPCRGQVAWPHLRLGSTLTFKRGLPDEKVKVNIGEKWKWRRASSSSNPQVVAQGRLLKRKRIDSSGGHQWVGRSFILLFHGNWIFCLTVLGSFSTFRFLISMVRWFLLRADHCLYSFKSDQVNVLKIFCHFLAATRVGPGHFFKYIMIIYKIYPSSHFSWLFQEHKRLFCKKHVNCLKASSNVHF